MFNGWMRRGILVLTLGAMLPLSAEPEDADVEGVFRDLVSQDPILTRRAMLDLQAMSRSSETLLNALIESQGLYRNSSLEMAQDSSQSLDVQVLMLCVLGSLDAPMVTDTLASLVKDDGAPPVLRALAATFLKDRMSADLQVTFLGELRALAPRYEGLHVPAMILSMARLETEASSHLLMEMARGKDTSSSALAGVALAAGLYTPGEASAIVKAVLSRPELPPLARSAALMAAARLSNPDLEETLAKLDVRGMDPSSQALLALGLSPEGPGASLLAQWSSSKDVRVASAALASLARGQKDPVDPLKSLKTLCKDRRIDPETRAFALLSLATVGGQDEALRTVGLCSPDPEMRLAAVHGLDPQINPENAAAFRGLLQSETQGSVVAAILEAMDPSTLESVVGQIRMVSEPAVLVQALRAVRLCPGLGDRQSNAIQALLKHENADVREQALLALAAMKPDMTLVPREILASKLMSHLTVAAHLAGVNGVGTTPVMCEALRSSSLGAERPAGAREALIGRLSSSITSEVLGLMQMERAMGFHQIEQFLKEEQKNLAKKEEALKPEVKPEIKKEAKVEKVEKKEEKADASRGMKIKLKAVDPKTVFPAEGLKSMLKGLGASEASLPQWIKEGKSMGEHLMESSVDYQVGILEFRLKHNEDSRKVGGKWVMRMSPAAEAEFLRRNPGATPEVFGYSDMWKRDVEVTSEGTKTATKKKGKEKIEEEKKPEPPKVRPAKVKRDLVDWKKYRVAPLDIFRQWVESDRDFQMRKGQARHARGVGAS